MKIVKLRALREHCQCHEWEPCRHGDVEEHLDGIQAEEEELLKRIPARDTTPAHITLTAH